MAPGRPFQRDEVLETIRRRVLRFAMSRVRRMELAEDVAQETMLVLTRRYADLPTPEDLVAVAIATAANVLRGHWHRSSTRLEMQPPEDGPERADEGPTPEDAAVQQERFARFLAALDRVPERCRELLRMRLSDVASPEIQERLGARSLSTVFVWEHRCRKQLLQAMGDRPPEGR